jgi:hypothetical protein
MRGSFKLIILLLAFGLLVQNTCPHGFAGKSSVAASTCSHCKYKQGHQPAPDSGKASISSHSTTHPPMFVLDTPNTQPTFRLAAIAIPQPIIPNTYKNTAPDELLQPPRA